MSTRQIPSTVKAYTGLITTGVFVAGTFINLLSVFSASCYTKTSTKGLFLLAINVFIANLILDAFFYPVTGLHVIQHWPHWQYTETLCDWSSLAENACTTVVTLSLLLLAIDRYYVTIKRKALPFKTVMVFSILIWAISGCLNGIYSFTSNPITIELGQGNVSICNAFVGDALLPEQSIYGTVAIVNISCLTLSVLIILRVGVFVWRKKIRGQAKTKKCIKQEFTVVLLIIIFAYMFCTPKWAILIARGLGSSVTARVVILAHVIGSLNSTVTGVIFLMFSKDFRRSFLDILRGCKKSSLCFKTERVVEQEDGLKELLVERNPNKKIYQDASTASKPKFVRGKYKTCDKEMDLRRVSIDTDTLEEQAGPGRKNEIFEQIDSKF